MKVILVRSDNIFQLNSGRLSVYQILVSGWLGDDISGVGGIIPLGSSFLGSSFGLGFVSSVVPALSSKVYLA